jgi:hypothetical protein
MEELKNGGPTYRPAYTHACFHSFGSPCLEAQRLLHTSCSLQYRLMILWVVVLAAWLVGVQSREHFLMNVRMQRKEMRQIETRISSTVYYVP